MTGSSKGRRAAIGFRAHSGWACAILLAGSKHSPTVIDRRRIVLCDPQIEGSKQPFHAAEEMSLADARAYLARCTRATDRLATAGLKGLDGAAKAGGFEIVGAGQTAASGRPLPDLAGILASHSLIHAAEGEFYRDALARACAKDDLQIARIRERELPGWTASRLGWSDAQLKARLAAYGKELGPPWTADEKLATMAAWLALDA